MFNFLKSKRSEPKNIKSSCNTYTGGQTEIMLQDNDFLYYALGYGNGLFDKISFTKAMTLYRQSSSVATAIDITAQEMARISPVIKNPDGSLNDTHPLLDKLRNPNDWNEDWSFFFGSLARAYLTTGNCFPYASGIVTKPPLELFSIKPNNINTIGGNMDQRPMAYIIGMGDGRGSYERKREKIGFRFYENKLKELFPVMMYSSETSNFAGDSPLMAICLDINSQLKGRIHNVKLLENGARPSLLVAFKDTLTADQHIERRNLINEQLAGSDNAGKIAVISSTDMELKEMGINNKDMDYKELENISNLAVYNRYRIPLALVTNDASTYNNLTTAVTSLYDFAVLPRTDELLSALSIMLMPRYGLDHSQYRLSYNPDEIEALKQRRIDILAKRKELNIETINELREALPNREDVDGGEEILVQSTMIKLSEVGVELEEQVMTVDEEAEQLIERDTDDPEAVENGDTET